MSQSPDLHVRATTQDGSYPRPQLLRPTWHDLSGTWSLAFDPDDVGRDQNWQDSPDFDSSITVPFPPESPASGIGDPGPHRVVWYARRLDTSELRGSDDERTLLHFGAVDYRADVWLAGRYLGEHVGGQTPFTFDVTAALPEDPDAPWLVVRAEDDPSDVEQPRGKQDWKDEQHSIWYHRTTGIWQPVWMEQVPATHVSNLAWETDVPGGALRGDLRLNRRPTSAMTLELEVTLGDDVLARQTVEVHDPDVRLSLDLPVQSNGQQYEELLWSPETPTLLDVRIRLGAATGRGPHDVVYSYVGLRSVRVGQGHLFLNDRPFYLRSVLEQGYWPQSHLAAPSAEALRAEVQLIKDLGFNSARVHQKAEDPRFLFWADRLGLTLWAETANAYQFSPRAVALFTHEWMELVRRDRSHPSIIAWVPMNESWGIQHLGHVPAQRNYSVGVAALTRALDPTRPVISNDGWEHTDSDIWSVHDYAERGDVLRARYGTAEAVQDLLGGVGPAGRRMRVTADPDRGQPVMLTEFGGIKYAVDGSSEEESWGYSTAQDGDDFARRLRDLLDAVLASRPLTGFCYTQLTDTGLEINGLVTADRRPKLAPEVIREIMGG